MTDPQERIAQLEAELAAQRREMQEFTATVSHDLRAPLRHIVSFAALVQEDAGPQLSLEAQGFLGTIAESAKQLGAMLDALRELSRVGALQPQIQDVRLDELVRFVCDELQPTLQGRQVQCELAADTAVCRTDASMLHQALLHIVGNAVKFTASCAAPVIQVRVERLGGPGGALSLVVSDNGAGFDSAQQDRLFKVFGRLHPARQFPGLGMGLVTSKKIMERLGGCVTCTALPGGGCRAALILS